MSHKNCGYRNIRPNQIDPPECIYCDEAIPELKRLEENKKNAEEILQSIEEQISDLFQKYPELDN